MNIETGKKHAEDIGYFVVREEQGTAEILIEDHEQFDEREKAEAWIGSHGLEGVDYWVCACVARTSMRRRG